MMFKKLCSIIKMYDLQYTAIAMIYSYIKENIVGGVVGIKSNYV